MKQPINELKRQVNNLLEHDPNARKFLNDTPAPKAKSRRTKVVMMEQHKRPTLASVGKR